MSEMQIEVLKWLAIFVFACGTACAMAGALFAVSALAKTGVDNVLKAVAYANDLPHNFKKLRAIVKEHERLRAENERLRAAIAKHRNDIWGRCEVGHPTDAELYAALAAGGDE